MAYTNDLPDVESIMNSSCLIAVDNKYSVIQQLKTGFTVRRAIYDYSNYVSVNSYHLMIDMCKTCGDYCNDYTSDHCVLREIMTDKTDMMSYIGTCLPVDKKISDSII